MFCKPIYSQKMPCGFGIARQYTCMKVLLEVFLDSQTENDSDVTDCFSG